MSKNIQDVLVNFVPGKISETPKMKEKSEWEIFCESHNIPERYAQARRNSLIIPGNSKGSFQQKIDLLVKKPRDLILSGQPGRGKTHFMFALMHEMFSQGICTRRNTRFYRSIELDNVYISSFQEFKTTSAEIDYHSRLEFLFLDDFGMVRLSERAYLDYYDLLDRRMFSGKVTIFSTNFTEKELMEKFGERIYSRLAQCSRITFNGPDLRKKEEL